MYKRTSKLFMRLFRGGELGAYKIKSVFAFDLLVATKTLLKRNKKFYFDITYLIYAFNINKSSYCNHKNIYYLLS